jgi:hypothetical protein
VADLLLRPRVDRDDHARVGAAGDAPLVPTAGLPNLKGGFDGAGGGALLFAPDGKTLVGQCNEPIDVGVSRSSLRQWDATTGNMVRDLNLGSFHRVAFNADGKVLAAGPASEFGSGIPRPARKSAAGSPTPRSPA